MLIPAEKLQGKQAQNSSEVSFATETYLDGSVDLVRCNQFAFWCHGYVSSQITAL